MYLFTIKYIILKIKITLTILGRAIIEVPDFENVIKKLSEQIDLRGQSKITLQNYIKRIALFVIHFKCLPENASKDETNEYLAAIARDPKASSRSSLKHMVYDILFSNWVRDKNQCPV